ncbi:TerB family tellurite resistance protein [Paracoccus sp. PAMC 22219]|uniref:tellurite resistance TerB family protein n=1 Tax=Paracoccus sp. PAMC 22219 TaxID=1569209 RepID=UPI000A70E1BD|nr:TerB family tellurite resistance protein [Paracoccus sp. PAMC 22219]
MDLLTRLMGDTAGPIDSGDAELAIAALLVRVARADDHYDQAERDRIEQVLSRRGLTAPEAAARRAQAEALEAEASDTVRFTRQIKDRIALEDRRAVLAGLWEVALADHNRGADEDSLIRLVSSLLGMTDRESAQIRQQVLARMGLEP